MKNYFTMILEQRFLSEAISNFSHGSGLINMFSLKVFTCLQMKSLYTFSKFNDLLRGCCGSLLIFKKLVYWLWKNVSEIVSI
jgi:hypothetical protein